MTPGTHADGLTNIDVVTYALAALGGVDRPVHLEHIAAKAFELAPGRFRWDLDEYAEFIDKDKVRASLTDTEKTTRGFAQSVGAKKAGVSKPTDQWRLTAEGARWIIEHEERIRSLIEGPTPGLKKGKASIVRRRITENPLFEEFEATGSVSGDPYAFTDLLECSPDASIAVIEQRFDALLAQTRLLDQQRLLEFLDACAIAHADMFGKVGR